MRQRRSRRYTDLATIKRTSGGSSTNAINEPTGGSTDTVADNVPCMFLDESTEYVREDSGERVNRPATVRFPNNVDIEEGDTVEIDRVSASFEVRGVETVRDARRDRTQEIRADLERSD